MTSSRRRETLQELVLRVGEGSSALSALAEAEPASAEVRTADAALATASEAVGRLLRDPLATDLAMMTAAWEAVARAQDAIVEARARISTARGQGHAARDQTARAAATRARSYAARLRRWLDRLRAHGALLTRACEATSAPSRPHILAALKPTRAAALEEVLGRLQAEGFSIPVVPVATSGEADGGVRYTITVHGIGYPLTVRVRVDAAGEEWEAVLDALRARLDED
jgi:hypothetical protein